MEKEDFNKIFEETYHKTIGSMFVDSYELHHEELELNLPEYKEELRKGFIAYRTKFKELLEGRDAYKLPFSNAEIDMELVPNHREIKRVANKWYQKGRDDEYNSKLD